MKEKKEKKEKKVGTSAEASPAACNTAPAWLREVQLCCEVYSPAERPCGAALHTYCTSQTTYSSRSYNSSMQSSISAGPQTCALSAVLQEKDPSKEKKEKKDKPESKDSKDKKEKKVHNQLAGISSS